MNAIQISALKGISETFWTESKPHPADLVKGSEGLLLSKDTPL